MRIVLYADNTFPLAIGPICKLLNSLCVEVEFSAGTDMLRIDAPQILSESIRMMLPERILSAAEEYDYAIMCTNIPYENNYFIDSIENIVLISFYGWNLYTDLPVTNGLVFFIAAMLADEAGLGEPHDVNIGCLKDFWWDKRGVDVGMRAAYICGACRDKYTGDVRLLDDIQRILDLISSASRSGKDILSIETIDINADEKLFDVFLCHNSDDKPLIRKINVALQSADIVTWLDEEQLKPGTLWQDELDKQISRIRSACVFVGKNGRGPWHNIEIRAFLNEFANRGCLVIPVILPDAPEIPDLPTFLKQMTWVDLRKQYNKGIARLVAALRHK